MEKSHFRSSPVNTAANILINQGGLRRKVPSFSGLCKCQKGPSVSAGRCYSVIPAPSARALGSACEIKSNAAHIARFGLGFSTCLALSRDFCDVKNRVTDEHVATPIGARKAWYYRIVYALSGRKGPQTQ